MKQFIDIKIYNFILKKRFYVISMFFDALFVIKKNKLFFYLYMNSSFSSNLCAKEIAELPRKSDAKFS